MSVYGKRVPLRCERVRTPDKPDKVGRSTLLNYPFSICSLSVAVRVCPWFLIPHPQQTATAHGPASRASDQWAVASG
jgi:hypothetical protein